MCAEKQCRIVRAEIPDVPESPVQIVEIVKREFTPKTRVLYFSHIAATNGLITPVREICAAAREHCIITVIDGAHAPGMIPLDVPSLGCDYYTGNNHKWLCAPLGSAFLWASRDKHSLLGPLTVGWGWDAKNETLAGIVVNEHTDGDKYQ